MELIDSKTGAFKTWNSDNYRNSEIMFKECPNCDAVWSSRNFFLSDPCISLLGYHEGFKNLTPGLFYFNHSCKSTLAVALEDFQDLYEEPISREKMIDVSSCADECVYKTRPDLCPSECGMFQARGIVGIIKNWPKRKR